VSDTPEFLLSAEFLAAKWEVRATAIDAERQHLTAQFTAITSRMNAKVIVLRECADELRRHIAANAPPALPQAVPPP